MIFYTSTKRQGEGGREQGEEAGSRERGAWERKSYRSLTLILRCTLHPAPCLFFPLLWNEGGNMGLSPPLLLSGSRSGGVNEEAGGRGKGARGNDLFPLLPAPCSLLPAPCSLLPCLLVNSPPCSLLPAPLPLGQ